MPRITGKGKSAAFVRDLSAATRIRGAMRRAICNPLTVAEAAAVEERA